jgi:hypothetical protein
VRPTFDVKIVDEKWRGVLARIRHARSGLAVKVGIPEGVAHPDADITIAEIGAIHEYGSAKAKIPRRSWLARTFKRADRDLKSQMRTLATAVTAGRASPSMALAQLGQWAVEAVRRSIYMNIPPPLTEYTVRRKGHRLALVDSGALIRAITWFREAS